MLNRSNSVNQQLNYKKPNILSKIYKFQTIHLKNQDNSAVKLPALKNIKNIIKQSELIMKYIIIMRQQNLGVIK